MTAARKIEIPSYGRTHATDVRSRNTRSRRTSSRSARCAVVGNTARKTSAVDLQEIDGNQTYRQNHYGTTRPLLRVVSTREKSLPKIRTKNQYRMRITVLVATFAVSAALIVWMLIGYTTITRMNHEITAISNEITAMEANRDTLAMQLRPYTSDGRIEQLAKDRLAMDYPSESQVVAIQSTPTKPLLTASSTDTAVEQNSVGSFGVVTAIAGLFSGMFQ